MFYRCSTCSQGYPRESLRWRCDCGDPLELSTPAAFSPAQIDPAEASLWRYASALPSGHADSRVTLGEGWTPLVEIPRSGASVFAKLDYLMPSGSFKDRGTAVLISELRARGVSALLEDSSGNAGASLATYAATAGIPCEVYVPESTSAGKLVQIRLAGATLRRIPGSREATADAALIAANDPSQPFYASHNWHPLFIEGVKTVGFEMWEQLGQRAPACVIAPAGNGSMILGLHRAFMALQHAGAIDRLPMIIAAQAASCAPLVEAFNAGLEDVPTITKHPTLAEGIASARPIRARAILSAIRSTGGVAIAVPEEALIPGVRELAERGFFVEPTSAVVQVAYSMLREQDRLPADGPMVLLLSGSGLKATEALTHHA